MRWRELRESAHWILEGARSEMIRCELKRRERECGRERERERE